MARYLLLRLLDMVPTVFLVLTMVFIAMRILPGDPALSALGANADGGQLEAFRERMGLNDPLWLQYVNFLWDAVRLDFGNSLMSNVPIRTLIANNLPHTIYLTLVSVAMGLIIGIPLGIYAATQRNKAPDNGLRIYSLVGYSVPDFYLGAVLLVVFSLNLGWFPINGAGQGFWDGLHHIILPAMALALLKSAFIGRLTRTSLLEVMGRDYVRTARAKGAQEKRVIFRHALRNALLPLSTGIGLSILATLSGSVAIELVFNRPGIGRLLISGIQERDYPVTQAAVMMFAVFVVLVNLLMDLVYILVDPRIRLKS